MAGTVKRWDAKCAFGFIRRDDGGPDIFVHASALVQSGIAGGLQVGQRVAVEITETPKGLRAVAVRLV